MQRRSPRGAPGLGSPPWGWATPQGSTTAVPPVKGGSRGPGLPVLRVSLCGAAALGKPFLDTGPLSLHQEEWSAPDPDLRLLGKALPLIKKQQSGP